jgi:prepilin-type N-terminal cleavage/methylation domain-containing protein
MKTKQTGFTLVEIAIVLVIIGLLLGGILKGQEMIIQAKVKNSITDFSGVSAAYYGYQDRYRAIPGDDPLAERWGAATATPPVLKGNGDRILTGVYDVATSGAATAPANESANWWDHLRRSGFITGGTGNTNPINSFNGILGAQQGDGAGVGATTPVGAILLSVAAATDGFTNLVLCSTNLPDKVAIALDVQMDDGLSAKGAVRSVLSATAITAAGVAVAAYQETGTITYTVCRQF